MRTNAAAAVCALALAGMQVASADAVARASAYAAAYDTELGGMVAQEDYRQDLPQKRRVLKSDYMLVKFSTDGPWLPFRDVLEADGVKVGDREKRLERLFLSAEPGARENAERISRESSRYNLGTYYRSINTPVLGIEYLKPYALERSRFGAPRREAIDRVEAWHVDFEERGSDTVIHDGDGRALPATGTVWIRASDGAILRTRVRLVALKLRSEVETSFCAVPSIAVLVPCKMTEAFNTPGESITGVATYTNVRQFKVTTSEAIKH